jgi:hypothetical protein
MVLTQMQLSERGGSDREFHINPVHAGPPPILSVPGDHGPKFGKKGRGLVACCNPDQL